jgi:hypothetical protein
MLGNGQCCDKFIIPFINVAYQGRINTPSGFVNQMSVTRWLRGDFLPSRCQEFFPPPDGAGRFSQAAVALWVKKWLLRPSSPMQPGGAVNAFMTDYGEELKKERALMARREREEYEKTHDEKWMLVVDHDASLRYALAFVWSETIRKLEVDLPVALDAMEKKGQSAKELVEYARVWGREAIDGLQRAFTRFAKGLTEPEIGAPTPPQQEPAAPPPQPGQGVQTPAAGDIAP